MEPEKRAKWYSHLGPILIAYNVTQSLITGYSPYFLMFGHQPRLPVNLLFLTMRQDENTQTTDEYVTSLYDKLKLALASTRDTAILEAQRQKQHYDCKARAVELHPGDKVLVKLDAFRSQWQKLKNRWGDTLYTVVKHVADRIPAYEVENDVNKKRQVLHQARLLLWLAKPEGEPLRINCISIKSGLTRAELATPLRQSVKLGVVPCKLIYGLNTAMFESRQESPELTMGNDAWGVLTGVPHNGTGYRIPCDKFSHRRSLQALLRDVSARWVQPTQWRLESWSYRGAGNRMGWPLTETLGTQVPRSLLTNLWRELCLCRLPNEPPFLFSHLKPRLAWEHAIFLHQGGELEMRLLWREVPRLWTCQEWRVTREQYLHITFWDRLNCLPGVSRNNQRECRLYKVYKHLFLKLLNAEMPTTKL